jgi:hypothetical protein
MVDCVGYDVTYEIGGKNYNYWLRYNKNIDVRMDPFIIIKNYRQSRVPEEPIAAPRLFLRELDPNTLTSRPTSLKLPTRLFCEDDKENFNFMMDLELGEDMLKGLPAPNNMQLINYDDYDLNY